MEGHQVEMGRKGGYRVEPFSPNRSLAAASAAVCRERDTIHGITEVDASEPRRLLQDHRERTGEVLSFTAYVVACLVRAVSENPYLNAMRKGGKLILRDDITVGVLVERAIDGERVQEPFGVHAARCGSYLSADQPSMSHSGTSRSGPFSAMIVSR
jgi:pyruvate/2-oxoglutarate dehydrogenase complex dihydrolipoamide acyltransferase (E2) component